MTGFSALSRPVRLAVWSQVLVTVVATALGGWIAGWHGALSASLGGSISVAAGLAFAAMASRGKARSAGEALFAALKAEAVKIGVMVFLLLVVLATYKEVVVAGLIASFIATVLSFSFVVLIREA